MYQGRDYQIKKSSKVYISNLKQDTNEDDLRKAFGKFGPIQSINLKQKNDFTFAFVQFDAVAEAENAVNELDGKTLNGNQIKVKFAHGGNDRRGGFQDRGRGRSFGDREDRGGYRGRGGFDGPRRDFGDRPRGCFNCGQEGHMIKDCPKPKKPREGGFERRPYDNNREGGQRRNYGDNRGGYDRGGNQGRGGYQSRGRDSYGGDRRGGYGDKRRDQRRRSRSSSARSRSNQNKGGRRQRSSSSRS